MRMILLVKTLKLQAIHQISSMYSKRQLCGQIQASLINKRATWHTIPLMHQVDNLAHRSLIQKTHKVFGVHTSDVKGKNIETNRGTTLTAEIYNWIKQNL